MKPIECKLLFPTLKVRDIQLSLEFYIGKLGFKKVFLWGEPVTYAGVGLGDVIIHLAQNSADTIDKAEVNFIVGDADFLYASHQLNGVSVLVRIDDREYGLRDYAVIDPDGNQLGFGHYIYNQGEPVYIERVDVPVRLEKRLAALLGDLAGHKNMTVSSCLEEMLLHGFERHGDSVASPHTSGDLDHIALLKVKHGIDYDTHASYRFKE